MRKPVLLSHVSVRPITGNGPSPFCMVCMKNEGRWAVGFQPNDYVTCAPCFLYVSPWGRKNAGDVAELVYATERELGMCISNDGVVLDGHADRILAAIVLTTNMARGRRG